MARVDDENNIIRRDFPREIKLEGDRSSEGDAVLRRLERERAEIEASIQRTLDALAARNPLGKVGRILTGEELDDLITEQAAVRELKALRKDALPSDSHRFERSEEELPEELRRIAWRPTLPPYQLDPGFSIFDTTSSERTWPDPESQRLLEEWAKTRRLDEPVAADPATPRALEPFPDPWFSRGSRTVWGDWLQAHRLDAAVAADPTTPKAAIWDSGEPIDFSLLGLGFEGLQAAPSVDAADFGTPREAEPFGRIMTSEEEHMLQIRLALGLDTLAPQAAGPLSGDRGIKDFGKDTFRQKVVTEINRRDF